MFRDYPLSLVNYLKACIRFIEIITFSFLIDRLIYTLQLQVFSLIPLFISLNEVMFTRLFTPALNPLSGNEKLVEKSVRILTNTVEQLLLNVINQLILATFIPVDFLFIIPFLVFLFTVGRITFLIGYSVHPKYRTIGFILTFVPSFVLLAVNILYVTGLNRYVSLPLSLEQSNKKVEL